MNISVEDKVALVTGAAMGLGLATARACAEAGASVVLADWDEDAVQAATRELVSRGHDAIAGLLGGAKRGVYHAAKHGVIGHPQLGARVRGPRDPHQRGLPRSHGDADVRPDEGGRAGRRAGGDARDGWVTHLAFYAGWPSVFSALPIVKAVLEKRPG